MNKNEIVLERIRKWQEEPVFHELTCGNSSLHDVLKGEVRDGKIVLVCKDCDYVQEYVPDMFFEDSFDEAYRQQKEMMDRLSGRNK